MNTDRKEEEKQGETHPLIFDEKEELLDVALIYNVFPEQTE